MRIPTRASLPSEVASILREQISSGSLTGSLPGERVLSDRLCVSRNTLRLALAELEAEGLISQRAQGRSRTILTAAAAMPRAEPASRRVAMLSSRPLGEMPAAQILELDLLRASLAKANIELEIETAALHGQHATRAKVEKLVRERVADAWILYQADRTTQLCFAQFAVPTLVRGTLHAGVDLPFVDTDWRATAFHAGGLLRREGHRSIVLMTPNSRLAGVLATAEGLAEGALVAAESSGARLEVISDEGQDGRLLRSLSNLLQRPDPPSALVATRARHVFLAQTWLASRGLKVPDDVSLLAICQDEAFHHLYPRTSYYSNPAPVVSRLVTRTLLRLLDLSSENPVQHRQRMMPDFVPGGSVAKPRG